MRSLMMVILMLALMPGISNAWAATYFIDFASGNDTNTGITQAFPWKRAPGMNGFAGTYQHQAGDRFIFKGGVMWPAGVFPLSISNGGNSSAADYYGVDKTWYVGSNWSRPIFDGGGTANTWRSFVIIYTNYVTLDNFEMTNYYWNASTGGYGTSYIHMGKYSNIHIINNYLHGWSHSADAEDDLDILLGNYPPSAGNLFDSNIVDGEVNGATSGMAVHNGAGTFSNNIIKNIPNGLLPCSGEDVVIFGNILGPFNGSFSGRHENAIEPLGPGKLRIYNNVIFQGRGVTVFVGNPAPSLAYIFNNVIYDNGGIPAPPTPIKVDGRGSLMTVYAFNNTLQHNGDNIDVVGGNFYLMARNNHLIDGGVSGANVQSNSFQQTSSQAAAAGYTVTNLYAPTSAGSPTLKAGMDLSSFCAADQAGTALCADRQGHPRGSTWDIGAYEYVKNGSGDVSGDGRVTMYDAALVLKYTVGGPLTTAQQAQADINGDTLIDVTDAAVMAKKAVGL